MKPPKVSRVSAAEAGERLRRAERVLLIKPHHKIGDLLVATPVIRNLRRALPDAELVFLAGRENAAAVLDSPDLDEVVVAPTRGPAALRLPAMLLGLRRRRFDVGLVLSTLSQSRTTVALARWCGAGITVGLDDSYARGLGNETFDCVLPNVEPGSMHMVDHGLLLLGGLGIPAPEKEHVLGVTGEQVRRGREALAAAGMDPERPVLGIQPGGAGHPDRRWPLPDYADVARRARAESQVVLLGLPQDRTVVEELQGSVGGDRLPEILEVPFSTYKGVLRNLTAFLTHDGGPAHIAAGVGVPVCIVFCSTQAAQWAPYGAHVSVFGDRGLMASPAEVWASLRGRLREGEESPPASGSAPP